MEKFFTASSVAIVGASKKPEKIGNVILKNFLYARYKGRIYPVNPKYDEIYGLKCYSRLTEIPDEVELAIIITPAKTIPSILEDAGKKGIRHVVVLSSGFGESGNEELEKEIVEIAKKHGIKMIGPNCLGIMNPEKKIDSVFYPFYKFKRPKEGDLTILTQSGGVGSALIDYASSYEIGMAKFISYGNAAMLDESDFLQYLKDDEETKCVMLYVEGVKDGRKFYYSLKEICKKKPVVVIKGGKYGKAKEAAKTHTGKLAGDYEIFKGVLKQANAIEVENIYEAFNVVKILNQPEMKGRNLAIVTNGGGFGVIASDAIEITKMKLAEFSEETKKKLTEILPSYATVANPLDIIADATVERFEKSIEAVYYDQNVDAVIVMVLFQIPLIDERIIPVFQKFSEDREKPFCVVAIGGDYTRFYVKTLEMYNIPVFEDPAIAVRVLRKYWDYWRKRKRLK